MSSADPPLFALADSPTASAPYQPHSATSAAAAQAITPELPALRQQVYDFLAQAGTRGATDEEMILATGLRPNTARPRRIELARAGLVADSGQRRPTLSGRKAVVWTIKQAASPV